MLSLGKKFQDFFRNLFRSKKPEQRYPRISIEALHDVEFTLIDNQVTHSFPVANVSSGGIGLLLAADSPNFKKDALFKGILVIKKSQFTLSIRIAHITGSIMGCAFTTNSTDLIQTIEEYFKDEFAAFAFSKVKSDILKKDNRGTPHWYRGRGINEIYFIANENEIIDFNISYLGNYIEGGKNKSTKFGYIVGTESTKYKTAAKIHYIKPPFPAELSSSVKKLLDYVPELSHKHRELILDMIKGAS